MTLLYTDPIFLKHNTGAHPESAHRLIAIADMLADTGLRARCTAASFEPFPAADLTLAHLPTVADQVRRLAGTGGGHLDADTIVSPASYDVALASAGACAAAARQRSRGTADSEQGAYT